MSLSALFLLLGGLSVLSMGLLWFTALAIALFGAEDLFFDGVWLVKVGLRRKPALPPLPPRASRFVIFIPAWKEAQVIARMLARLLATLQHLDYLVFVGVYPNDPETLQAVSSVCDPRILPVITARPGPTTKADCLNSLWEALLAKEESEGWQAKAIVLHDAEDVVHGDELSLFERMIPGLHMVQIPVVPFVDRHSRLVSGHYLDEFAESHGKDMLVREALGAAVPSAGVGTAIERQALGRIADIFGRAFDPGSLTEDYELGHRLQALGYKTGMVRSRAGGTLIATREFFPATFEASIRQKARWLTGIALAGWDRLGWPQGKAQRWMLWRDRKALASAVVAMLSYVWLLLVGMQMLLRVTFFPASLSIPPILTLTPFLRWLLFFNAVVLGWRLLMRCSFTWAMHGWREGLLALPRASVANVINFAAAVRAIRQYRRLVERGEEVVWDKTQHRFPDMEVRDTEGRAFYG